MIILTDVVYIHVNCVFTFGVQKYMYVISFELFVHRDKLDKEKIKWYGTHFC